MPFAGPALGPVRPELVLQLFEVDVCGVFSSMSCNL